MVQVNAGDIYYNGYNRFGDDAGSSVKISRERNWQAPILQFEYNNVFGDGSNHGSWWDLSDLDGMGPGRVGDPFFYENIKVIPTGNGAGDGKCTTIRCPAGQTCVDAYQNPDDLKTRWCPIDTGDMWLDLCTPNL